MTTKKQKEDFEKYLEKQLKEIYKKYAKIYGNDKAYLSMFFSMNETKDGMYFAANNNHWELDKELKLDKFWRVENE